MAALPQVVLLLPGLTPLYHKSPTLNTGARCVLLQEGKKPAPVDPQKLRDEAQALSFTWKTARITLYAVFAAGSAAGLTASLPAITADDQSELPGAIVDAVTLLAAIAGFIVDASPNASPAIEAATSPPPPLPPFLTGVMPANFVLHCEFHPLRQVMLNWARSFQGNDRLAFFSLVQVIGFVTSS